MDDLDFWYALLKPGLYRKIHTVAKGSFLWEPYIIDNDEIINSLHQDMFVVLNTDSSGDGWGFSHNDEKL